MWRQKRCSGASIRRLALAAAWLATSTFAVADRTWAAEAKAEADQMVELAQLAFERMAGDPNMEAMVSMAKTAKGIFICPELLKGAFIVGASGGSGVLLVRGEKTWYGPGFYTIGGASFGLQIGGAASEVALLAMTERGVTTLLSTSLKLGADAGVAVGPIGIGASAATANLSTDIISFSRSKGLYGGISLEGAVVAVRDAWNDAYYGKETTPAKIFLQHSATSSHAEKLIRAVEKVAGK